MYPKCTKSKPRHYINEFTVKKFLKESVYWLALWTITRCFQKRFTLTLKPKLEVWKLIVSKI